VIFFVKSFWLAPRINSILGMEVMTILLKMINKTYTRRIFESIRHRHICLDIMRGATIMDAEQSKRQLGRIYSGALAGLYTIVDRNAKKHTGKFTINIVLILQRFKV
jgi:hypothetical protein